MINQVVKQVVAGMGHYYPNKAKYEKIPRKIAVSISKQSANSGCHGSHYKYSGTRGNKPS
jgi:hypothetical protein